MHPELRHALARQRIEEIQEFARAPRARGGRSLTIRWVAWLGRVRIARGRSVGGQLESEAR